MAGDRIETDAYKTNSEISEKLNSEDSYCYKPWQFADYKINACTLKTTYEEVGIWTLQQAMFRPGFKVEHGEVYIPNIFAKVSGVHDKLRQYRKEMKVLKKQPNTMFFYAFPLYRARISKLTPKSYYSVLDASGHIDKYKLINSGFWRYRNLRSSLQNLIADRIVDFCELYRFKNYEAWSNSAPKNNIMGSIEDLLKTFDIRINLTPEGFEAAKIKVFTILNEIEEPLTKLLTKFDYPYYIPKVIVYNNGSSYSKVTFEDAVKLMFMSSMGIDVIIFNPSGYNDIEDYIREKYYDIHRLEKVAFNLPYSSWTWF